MFAFVLILMMCKYVRAPHTRLFSCRLMETAVVENVEREYLQGLGQHETNFAFFVALIRAACDPQAMKSTSSTLRKKNISAPQPKFVHIKIS
jgi:hypothetical protein